MPAYSTHQCVKARDRDGRLGWVIPPHIESRAVQAHAPIALTILPLPMFGPGLGCWGAAGSGPGFASHSSRHTQLPVLPTHPSPCCAHLKNSRPWLGPSLRVVKTRTGTPCIGHTGNPGPGPAGPTAPRPAAAAAAGRQPFRPCPGCCCCAAAAARGAAGAWFRWPPAPLGSGPAGRFLAATAAAAACGGWPFGWPRAGKALCPPAVSAERKSSTRIAVSFHQMVPHWWISRSPYL